MQPLNPITISIDVVPVDFDDPEVVPLVEAQVREIAQLNRLDPWALGDPEHYRFPDGIFLLARINGVAAGCAGLRSSFQAHVGEVKRIWTEPRCRRMGVASAIMETLERVWAPELGFTELIISTREIAPEALALFESRDFVAAPNDPRYGFWARTLVYAKILAA